MHFCILCKNEEILWGLIFNQWEKYARVVEEKVVGKIRLVAENRLHLIFSLSFSFDDCEEFLFIQSPTWFCWLWNPRNFSLYEYEYVLYKSVQWQALRNKILDIWT